ncbi:MAG: homocysteine S-methyltransferase family protein [bacterium]
MSDASRPIADHPILIFDGACGTNLQNMSIPETAWQGCEGCNEILNLTAPQQIQELHRSFFEAGSMVVETNTFGANRVVLAEYDLQDRVGAINRAAVENARQAAGDMPNRYVAGSMGPGTKLVSLGQIDRDALAASYAEQARALVEAGVDILLLETCQDLLQIKTALVAIYDLLESLNRTVPLMVSVTVEQTGTLLVGTDIAAVAATLEPYPIFSLGLNCATGPADMESHIRYLSHNWSGRISCMPNQGLPEVVDGQTVYCLKPDEYARRMKAFVAEYGVSVVGGCCGSSPEHIAALSRSLDGVSPAERKVDA